MATPATIREHYDFFAPLYHAFWGDHIHHGLFLNGTRDPEAAQLRMIEHCAQLAGIKPGWRVLDVGCGHGGTAIHLAKHHSCSVEGITISERQVQFAREGTARARLNGEVKFAIADADSYHFPVAAYDAVWTMESSEHFADKPQYFRNVQRTLKPGGVLVLAAWTGDMQKARVRKVAEVFLCPQLQTDEEYSEQITGAGLRVEHLEDVSAQVTRTWEICRERLRWSTPLVRTLPAKHRNFVKGIGLISEAYRSGQLGYSILMARKHPASMRSDRL